MQIASVCAGVHDVTGVLKGSSKGTHSTTQGEGVEPPSPAPNSSSSNLSEMSGDQ